MHLLLVIAGGIVLNVWIARLEHDSRKSRLRDQVLLAVDDVRNNLNRELYSSINLTQGIVALVQMQKGITQSQFMSISSELISSSSIIQNVALAPNNVIRYIYPLKGNEKALGLDYSKNMEQYPAIVRAEKEKCIVLAGPVHLVQGGIGIIGRAPIFVVDSVQKHTFWGIASTVISFDSLIEHCGVNSLHSKYRIAIRGRDATGPSGEVFWGDRAVFNQEPVLLEVILPSGSWQIGTIPMHGWPVFNPFQSLGFCLGVVLVLFFTLFLAKFMQINHARSIELRKRILAESILEKKNRALHLLSQCNNCVVVAADEQVLLNDICKIAVRTAGYRMAWIGRALHDEYKTVEPITFDGPGEGFVDKIVVSWGENKHGHGTAGNAIRTRKPAIARDILNNPTFQVWHDVLLERDFAAAIAIPLLLSDDVYGVLIIYAAEPDAFDATEVELLEQLGSNISHGILAIRAEKERKDALIALEHYRDELEQRVQERTRELTLAKNAAEAADRIKSAFLATMSHELRTPLNSIIGFTGIMLQGLAGALTDEQHKQLTMVKDSANHLLALINDVLDISKIESGQLELRLESFSVHDAVAKAIQVVKPVADKKQLSLSCTFEDRSIVFKSDRRRVEQILINLLGNAVKFTDQGGVSIEIRQTAPAQQSNPTLQIRITDTGIGIRQEDINKLFVPFSQIDTGTTRKYEGTGLGLSICKKLSAMLGGTIDVFSDGPGKGATFILNLTGETDGKNTGNRR
jgi:signal transduction histidine kinase/sensor domain CHASE-containing protein